MLCYVMLCYVMESLDTSKYTAYSDLLGKEAPVGGTLPPELWVTALKPDI